MSNYTRRLCGTIFISTLCLLEAAFSGWMGFILMTASFPIQLKKTAFIFMLLTCLYKLFFHIWILFDPSITALADENNPTIKFKVYFAGTALLDICAAIVFLFSEQGGDLQDLTAAFGIIVAVGLLPLYVMIFEAIVYFTSDSSDSCLKCLKPFSSNETEKI